ncbi:hypothetical protein K3495_g3200 [Podosphaera aphanis]|nr:hypothetical protein K3495_g3200 [Podosphaera aphanis]
MENLRYLLGENSTEPLKDTSEQIISEKKDLRSLSRDSSTLGSQSSKAILYDINKSNDTIIKKRPRDISDEFLKNTIPDTSSPTQECTCSSDPKIPRPRNAFILYRQHFQAQVVAQNPKLANPEVSKVIGEQWKKLAPEAKDIWKRLAEEEKQRHLQKYPGYRYQPRRASKMISTSSGSKTSVCVKCNGRFKMESATPSRSSKLTSDVKSCTGCFQPCKFSTIDNTKVIESPTDSGQMGISRLEIPRTWSKLNQQHLRIHQDHKNDVQFSNPPSKRRRIHKTSPLVTAAHPMISPKSSHYDSRYLDSFASASEIKSKIQDLSSSEFSEKMGPLRQQTCTHQLPDYEFSKTPQIPDNSINSFPSLSEAIKSGQSHLQSSEVDLRQIQAQSVKKVIMSIPFIKKIMILGTICPALGKNISRSPSYSTHGALIAVEGIDDSLREHVGTFITNYIKSHPFYTVKSWSVNDSLELTPTFSREINMVSNPTKYISQRDTRKSSQTIAQRQSIFTRCLSTICEWHEKSLQIKRYLYTSPNLTFNEDDATEDSTESRVIPIAVIPNGFSVAISDNLALRLPIEDHYTPVDHWHWIATLWRGIVGPNLTIFVTRVGPQEIATHGHVELCAACPVIIVRVLAGDDINDCILRRLGFEVLNFLTRL